MSSILATAAILCSSPKQQPGQSKSPGARNVKSEQCVDPTELSGFSERSVAWQGHSPTSSKSFACRSPDNFANNFG
eukprot:scaffold154750_cov34-Prasinocladus_malaysianus.AAC.1